MSTAETSAVDEIVVHQGRQVHELDRDSGDNGRLGAGRRGEIHE